MKRLALACAAAAVTAVALFGDRYVPVLQASTAPLLTDAAPAVAPDLVTALGRLEPKDGVVRVAGPSRPSAVVGQLLVDDNDPVTAGQTIAILDSYAADQATVAQLEAELTHAEAERRRHATLLRDDFVSRSEYEAWQTKAAALRAQVTRARAELELAVVRAPITGQVLEVHARPGERVGADGIAELGQTQVMTVVAEVYETDVGRVRLGQRATASSPALAQPVQGTVDRIGLKIGKKDVLDVDPAAKTDARVVAVRILLDDAALVAGLTNLEVDVTIAP
ncbi:MAG: efflux RND transporter periplasmic adaptor subunit [Candidatus Binatia bacterium]